MAESDSQDLDRVRDELTRIAHDLRSATQRVEAILERRDALVWEASELGLSRREVAALGDLTPGRVQQVIDARRKRFDLGQEPAAKTRRVSPTTRSAEVELADECFLMAPLGAPGSAERRRADLTRDYIIAPAVKRAGLRLVRADDSEGPGRVTSELIQHVLGARVCIADLTGLNPNVFYELGVRHTAQLPVVLIGEQDAVTTIPFDVAGLRIIAFDSTNLESAARASEAITAYIHEALAGSDDSPISTALNVGLLASGTTVERTLASLVVQIQELSRSNAALIRRLAAEPSRSLDTQAATMRQLGALALTRADLDEAERRLHQALTVAEASGDQRMLALLFGDLGQVAQARGDLDSAEQWYQRSLAAASAGPD